MLHWIIAVTIAALPTVGIASDWQRLTGSGITKALTSRVLGYPDGTLQDFHAGGRTILGMHEGAWKVEDDLYCLQRTHADGWTCFVVEGRGLDIRFTAGDGSVMVGRYVDLQ